MRTPQPHWTRLAGSLMTLALVMGACGGSTAADGSRVTVVTTTNVLADVVRAIGGDAVRVTGLVPPGADPHDYAASSAQIADLQAADLVVSNGLHLEEGLQDALDQARADGANILEIAPLLDPIPFSGADLHDGEGEDAHEGEAEEAHDEDAHEGLDPHVWLDPVRMADAAEAIGDALAALDPDGDWPSRAAAYRDELTATHEEIVAILGVIPPDRRLLVTNHDALGYFADRYDFEIVGTVIPGGATLADPSSAELAELVETVEAMDVRAIFAETIEPSVLAETVASEVGAQVQVIELFTGSLGEEGSGAETLITAMITNARRIAEALG